MMQTRTVGRTGINLSVVGFGTAQLQMLPERQAVETLVRGFDLGVNWIHTAPDYGGIDPWIRKAIDASRREVMVLAAGPARTSDLPAFFENTCHVYTTRRLALYGLAGIEDLEWHGENVWGCGGMVEYLQNRKAEGRLGGIYCSTHGSADYVARLIDSGVFDAIMLAWNPLGFHQQSHAWARTKIGREYEDLTDYRTHIFPLAARRGVSLLIMKPFAGGLLCKSKALPPHDWYGDDSDAIRAGDVLRLILEEPGVCAVVPGCCSIEEAEENATAGHAPLFVPGGRRAQIARAVESLRNTLCSRCGKCETTCSHSLPIPAMFRDAYIWTSRNETNQASPAENYFDLHPSPTLACATCKDQTCMCPYGVVIPRALGRIHERMQTLREAAQHPGPSASFHERTIEGQHRVLLRTSDVPARMASRAVGVARFLVSNEGDNRWLAAQHDRRAATGIGVLFDGRLSEVVPLRNTVCPGEVSPLAFEFRAPEQPGTYTVRFSLMPLRDRRGNSATIFHSAGITVDPSDGDVRPKARAGLTHQLARLLERGVGTARRTYQVSRVAPRGVGRIRGKAHARAVGAPSLGRAYAVEYLEHSIPDRPEAGRTYGVRVTVRNSGTLCWTAHPAGGHGVEMLVFVGDRLTVPAHLPAAEVRTGAEVTWHIPFRAPDDHGPHRVRIELVQRGITAFADQGVPPWIIDIQVRPASSSRTAALLEIERKHNPWHYNPLAGIAQSRDGHPFPAFIARGQGCRVWDVEGNEFLDYTMGWGSTILGHADERIQAAIREVLADGTILPSPHPVEMEVSRMLIEDFPGADMVAFGKNGSDVCTIAARLARVITKKRTILSCGFHGWQDFALDYFTFEDCGIPFRDERCLHKFRFDDRAGFLSLYEQHRADLAAVMIEPAGPLLDEERGLAGEPTPEFLRTVADATRKAGALLIFDEIVTGFRYRSGSVQKATGIVPDLTCLGKAMASGMPLAAVIGPYRHFLGHFHKTHFNATFRGEVYSLAAARAAIAIYRSEPVADHIWRHGELLRRAIHDVCRQIGVAGECTGPPFRMAFVFREPDAHRRRLKRTLLMQELLKQRVLTVTGMMLPSYSHDDHTLERTVAAFGQALEVVAHADARNDLDRYIELALL